MTPEAALDRWLNGFGVPAYASTATPHDAGFPRITYDLVVDGWGGGEQNVPVSVWHRTDSEAALNAIVRAMKRAIGVGGVTLPCDGGMLWVKRGEPWAQAVRFEGDDEKTKRRYVNINIEYLVLD